MWQTPTAPGLAPLDHQKIDRWSTVCLYAEASIATLVAILYSWLLGLILHLVMSALLCTLRTWAYWDDLFGFPFPGPRLTTQSDRCCQNETLEMQPMHNEAIDSRWARMPYSNTSTYGYCPVDGEVVVYDSPPPYAVLPAANNSIMTNNAVITEDGVLAPAPNHFTNDKSAKPQERARSPTEE